MKQEIAALLAAIERLLQSNMEPARRAELLNLHAIWVARLKK